MQGAPDPGWKRWLQLTIGYTLGTARNMACSQALKSVVLLAVAVYSCGGQTSAQAVGDSGASSGDDASPDTGWSPECGNDSPSLGAACAEKGLQCQYGSDPRADCNPIVVCGVDGTWGAGYPANDCPAPPNPSDCPADWGAVPRGQSCSSGGTNCWYGQGSCACRQEVADGGGLQTVWWCDDPSPSSCPVPYPRIGSSCTGSDTVCTYKPCLFAVSCQNGMWQEATAACGS